MSVLERNLALREQKLRLYNRQVGWNVMENQEWSRAPETPESFVASDYQKTEEDIATAVCIETHNGRPHQFLQTATSAASPISDLVSVNSSKTRFSDTRQWKNSSNGIYAFAEPLMAGQLDLVFQLDTVVVAMDHAIYLRADHNTTTDSKLPASPTSDNSNNDLKTHGHIHTLSTTLLSCVSCTPNSASCASFSTARTWDAPKSLLKRLLETSSQLPIESFELTPVQVWKQTREHTAFELLTVERLKTMSDRLLESIKCYGFGGIVRCDFLDSLLVEAFPLMSPT